MEQAPPGPGPVSPPAWPGRAGHWGAGPAANWFDEDSQWTQDTDAYYQSRVNNAVLSAKNKSRMGLKIIFVSHTCR